jgi:nicotinamidase-related amidase
MSFASYPPPPYKFERLDKDKAILLIVDHQLGLLQLVKDYTTAEFRNNVLAHAELGKLFDLPTILTTSAENGPNGPLPKEITDMYPNAPFIRRNGEVNAWDNPDFRQAVEATGRKQVILGGIVTEVCTMFLALSLREAGYSVWANTEASGTATPKLAEDANRRMENAGVHLVSFFPLPVPVPSCRVRPIWWDLWWFCVAALWISCANVLSHHIPARYGAVCRAACVAKIVSSTS